jgi:aryl-alcohol dehydrogenase-like predicted oxidoreductase
MPLNWHLNLGRSGLHSEKIVAGFLLEGKRDGAVIATKFIMNLFAGDPTRS